MGTGFPKEVTSEHYHLWTDALHARALARQTRNEWDRGTYVRWTISTGWTCFESACKDALETRRTGRTIGGQFKADLFAAVAAMGLPKLDWGSDIWQRVESIHQLRIDYVHRTISQERLFAPLEEADRAITTLREGIRAIYEHANKMPPDWIQDDEDRGWDGGHRVIVHQTTSHIGADPDDPEVIRVTYIFEGREYTRAVLLPGTDPDPYYQYYQLLRSIQFPISEIRVYRGHDIIRKEAVRTRGS